MAIVPHADNYKDPKNVKSLLQRELDINQQQQKLLHKRISTIKDYARTTPKDPQYAQLFSQVYMDQIELDELQEREEEIIGQIGKFKG